MLRATLRRGAQEARKPMMRFPDRKKNPPKGNHEPHPHPAAPKEIAQDFSHFQEVFQSGPHFHPELVQSAKENRPAETTSSSSSSSSSSSASSSSGGADIAEDLHDLPRRFWQTPSLLIEEGEMDAINSGGATLVQK